MMYAASAGGGAMTLVFKPSTKDSQKKATVSAVKVPVRPTVKKQ